MTPWHAADVRVVWDVVVVGAGPAGCSAGIASSAAGASTLLLDRAAFPRYKTCAGGLIGTSLAALPATFRPPVRATVSRATFSLRGGLARTRHARGRPLLSMVHRTDFDAALMDYARARGVKVRDGCAVLGVQEDGEVITLRTEAGEMHARAVVGADGSAGRVSRHVGVRYNQVDLGLEWEIPLTPNKAAGWRDRILIDWGPLPGSYGWAFPKDDGLTVGVIAARGSGEALRQYLTALVGRLGLTVPAEAVSGHLTKCRTPDSPLHRGGVLVAGDAAGLLEPWTREGISFALRSGRLAGEAAARMASATGRAGRNSAAAGYSEQVNDRLGAEMRAGALLLDAFTRRPAAFHAAICTLPPAWRLFTKFARGEASLAQMLRYRSLRAVLAVA